MEFGPPQTPQRPTPGAFINTPGRPPLFPRPSTQQPPAPPAIRSAAQTLTPIERAARTINDTLAKETRYPDVEGYVGQGISSDYDIPSNPAWTPFQRVKTYDIPERIFEQYNASQMSVRSGLFAGINHAWMAIDNQLYLWDYTHPNPELIGYEEQPHTIVAVELVVPRPKVFVDSISHLLVVATTADIHLIGVSCQRGPEGVHGLSLYKTGMQVSAKGILVGSIKGSAKTGRIFFSDGRDTDDVYEITYQQEDKWFSSRCAKINHVRKSLTVRGLGFVFKGNSEHVLQMAIDDTRNLLYTLSSESNIRVFHLKTANTLELVITRPFSTLKTQCGHMVRSDLIFGRDTKIISIEPISSTEAGRLSLVAITSTGCRIFLSTTSGSFYSDPGAPPSSMQVQHVRFPPAGTIQAQQPSSSNQLQPYQGSASVSVDSRVLIKSVAAWRYAPGLFLCFVEKTEGNFPTLFASAPDAGRISKGPESSQSSKYIENGQFMQLNGVLQDAGLVTPPFSAASSPPGFGNELAVQFDSPAPEIAILTHTGIQTIRRRRLVDMLAAALHHGGGEEGLDGDIRQFIRLYGRDEMSATALAVACGQGTYVGPDFRITKVSDENTLDLARKYFIEFGGKATMNENSTVDGAVVDNVRPSPRHDGIALYISRLVRSFWKAQIIKETTKPIGGLTATSTVGTTKLHDVQRDLVRLREFLEENKSFIDGLAGPEALGRAASRKDELELQGENQALTSLVLLINNIVEGISFVLVLFDERVEEMLLSLSDDVRQRVRQLTFETLFCSTSGKDLAKELVKAIVNINIAKGSNVEQVAESLRRKCGSFCSSDDVVIFKAQENLKKASDAGSNTERGRWLLNDSLRLFEQVAGSLSMEHLGWAVDQFIQMEFYAGAVRIALEVAKQKDRGNKALSWIRDNSPPQDVRKLSYEDRTKCYDLVHRVIQALESAASSKPDVVDGITSVAARRKQEAYSVINDSDDEVFQTYLYDWYLSQGWNNRLLDINSKYVVTYLQRKAEENTAHADLLWKYYAHYHNYFDAATVQHQLAKSGDGLSLERRIEYLSRAKANASTRINGIAEVGARNKVSRQELLRDITDLLDIAKIQDDILEKIKADVRLQGERRPEVLSKLDGYILPLDELYGSYADQAAYYDICLLIYHVADHRNLVNINHTWQNLIDQIHNNCIEQYQVPWEVVAERVRDLGRRLNLSETVFPVNPLLLMLYKYDVDVYKSAQEKSSKDPHADFVLPPAPETWVLDIFVQLGVPFEAILATLETAFYEQEWPYGANKKVIVKWIVYTAEKWAEHTRRQGNPYGGEDMVYGVADLLRETLGRPEAQLTGVWAERSRAVREGVEEFIRNMV